MFARKLLVLLFAVALCSPALARGPRGGSSQPAQMSVPAGYSNATAQGVANVLAYHDRVGHCGGNPGYEGCGMASTPQAAYSICCYANSGMRTVDVGYAQGKSGMWYCCRRYQ